MFEHLSPYRVILVSGPQRSGTTIAAKMIAADTGHQYVDEDAYDVYDVNRFRAILKCRDVVVHCPSMCHILHEVATDDIFVVLMIRNLDDIAASERRVDWTIGVYKELANYGLPPLSARRYRRHGGQIAPLKYARWWGEQRRLAAPYYTEIEYESLQEHPLWIPKEQRVNFEPRQTGEV